MSAGKSFYKDHESVKQYINEFCIQLSLVRWFIYTPITVTDSTPVADFTVREMARVKTREPAVGLTGLVYDLQMLRACFLQVEEHSTVQYHPH